MFLLSDDWRTLPYPFPSSSSSSSSSESKMLKPTLLQSQLFCCPPWDDLRDLWGFPMFENILLSKGDVGLLTESQSDKPLWLNPTNKPGTVKKELAL
jgi:hypothetical protein